jgi:intracellular multiplication protein IcmE
MTNNSEDENTDDFIESEIGAPEEVARPSSAVGNLAEAWRSRPLFKFMVLIVAVFAVGVAAVNFFGGKKTGEDVARLSKPPVMKEAPGGAVSPYMRQQTELANNERAQQAIATGGSAIPTPMGQTSDVGGFGAGSEKKDDPLKELRAETESLKKQVQQQQVQQQQTQKQQAQQQGRPEQFDSSLAEAMQHQMQQLLTSWAPQGIKSVTVSKAEAATGESAKGGLAASPDTSSSGTPPAKTIVKAGSVNYAQLLTEANSDVPGPILAQIVSGPLTGARAIGSFQVADGYEKYLVMKFTLADKEGKDYQINALALDPDTTLGGMATEVDERYFARVVLPAAAGFLQGMGQAMAQGSSSITTNGTTTITTQTSNGIKQGMYTGLSQGAQTMGQFFQQQANLTKPLVRVAAGTPFGLFFVSPVLEPSATGGTMGIQQNQGMGNGQGYGVNGGYPPPGVNGMNSGYPGNTISGYGDNLSGTVPYPNYANPGLRSTYGATASPYTQQNYGR